jgi:hypothetical protein
MILMTLGEILATFPAGSDERLEALAAKDPKTLAVISRTLGEIEERLARLTAAGEADCRMTSG